MLRKNKKTTPAFRTVWMLLVTAWLTSGCDRAPDNKDPVVIPPKTEASLFIGNEGQFLHGDASLTFIDMANNKSYLNAFSDVNGRPLGDVLQSIRVIGDYLFLVVNNSKKIEVVRRADLKSAATITGFSSPRYIQVLNPSKAYVSEFYGNEIKIINPTTYQITGVVPCGSWSEEMILIDKKLFVTSYQKDKIWVIDTQTDQLIDSIKLASFPSSLSKDKEGMLWVGCYGDHLNNARLFRVDPDSLKVVTSLTLNGPTLKRISCDYTGSSVFVLTDELFRVDIQATSFPIDPVIPKPGPGQGWYSMGVDPKYGDVYLSDAKDFQQASEIYHFDSQLNLRGSFKTGINSSSFCFYYP